MAGKSQHIVYAPSGTDRTLEEQADELLAAAARAAGKSQRKFGIIDERRQRTVNEREQSFTGFFARRAAFAGRTVDGD